MDTENMNTQNAELNIEGGTEQTEQTEKTYTEKELKDILQRETDKRVTQALKTQEQRFEKEKSLYQLDEQQREKAKAQMEIETLKSQLAEMKIQQNKAEIIKVLAGRNLPVVFADFFDIKEDLAESQQIIETFDEAFKAAVADEVKKRLASNNPVAGTSTPQNIKTMSLTERQKLYETNPALYNKLNNK